MAGKAPSTDQFPWSPIEVFQVNITPTEVSHWSENGARHTKQVRIGTAARNYAKQYAEGLRRSIQYYNQVRNAPNLFTIVIGVWQSIHKGSDLVNEDGDVYEGSDLDYETLFDILQNGISGKNYDPLRVVREKHRQIEEAIEREVIGLYSAGKDGKRLNRVIFESALKKIAEEYFDKVRDYVEGGNAPALSDKTINYFRPMKGVMSDTPLVSSGQLLNALTFRVYVEQTVDFKRHAELMANELKKHNAVEKSRKIYKAQNSRISADVVFGESKIVKNLVAKSRSYKKPELTQDEAIIIERIRKKEAVDEILKKRSEFMAFQNENTSLYGTNIDAWPYALKSQYIDMYQWLKSKQRTYTEAIDFLNTHGGESK